MTIILVMSATLPLAQVKSKFSEMIDRVEHTHDRIVVTRNGRPAAVMISPDDLASLEDTLKLLWDTDAMRELAEAKQAAATGDYITGDGLPAPASPRSDRPPRSLRTPRDRSGTTPTGTTYRGHRSKRSWSSC